MSVFHSQDLQEGQQLNIRERDGAVLLYLFTRLMLRHCLDEAFFFTLPTSHRRSLAWTGLERTSCRLK